MSYDEKFPEYALAIIGNNDEDAELRADAAAGIREYGRRHVKMLGEAGIQGLIGKLNQASAAGPDDLRRTVEGVNKKLLEFAKISQSTSREVKP